MYTITSPIHNTHHTHTTQYSHPPLWTPSIHGRSIGLRLLVSLSNSQTLWRSDCCFVLIRKSGSGPCIPIWASESERRGQPYLCWAGPGRMWGILPWGREQACHVGAANAPHHDPLIPKVRKIITSTKKKKNPQAFPSLPDHCVGLQLSGLI